MSQSGYTPIQLYRTTTAAAEPTAGNLAAGELAINLTDEKLFFKNAAGTVKLLAGTNTLGTVTSVAASGGTTGLTFSGSPITTSGTLTLGGTLGVANGGTGTTTAFTAGSVVFAGASGVYSQDNANLFWDNINGRLGIGTSAPGYQLDIASDDTTPGIGYAFRIRANATAAAGGIQFTNSNATSQWGFLSATATSVTLDASSNSNLAFRTNSTERMRITSEGQFRWGNSATIDTVSFLPFQVTGGIAINTNTTSAASAMSFFNGQGPNTRVGFIGTVGSSTSYNTASDYRRKNIDGPLRNSGAYIDALNPVQGSWKADGSRFIGLLAHEVQEVSETPIATGEKDGEEMQAMDYSAPELIANLIAEIQSLRARVAQLEGN
jgi:hypothetical protein